MNKYMRFLCFCITLGTTSVAMGVSTSPRATSQYIKPDTYNYMYPYMNNQMRTDLNPGVTVSQSTNPMDIVVKTKPLNNATSSRRVVPRRNAGNTARAVTNTTVYSAPQTNRRVVARRAANANTVATPRGATRYNGLAVNRNTASTTTTTKNVITPVSSARCMADYTECMNGYCERAETAYNRCYCSAKLSQIDAKYQSAIDGLIKQILVAKNKSTWSDAEVNEYWMETVGKYSNENSWENLDAALDIDWAGMESSVRGQNAFATGHQYCVQHLNNCYYMASNLRDAYRSEIARDCAAYEQSLQNLKSVAETVLEYYND
ncbi:MAG: hypothetical protein J6L70_00105 [Alphaproteobacteria bacterium]|nr:hypothetical protein [Alphaproteobacteria bacterium]